MRVLSGQTEAKQQHGRPENPLEIPDDRNRPALSGDHRLLAECLAERFPRRVEQRPAQLRPPRPAPVQVHRPGRYTLRGDLGNVSLHQLLDLGWLLIRNEPAAHLRHRLGRQHRLRSLTGVSAQQAVHLARRSYPQPLEYRVPLLASERRHSDFIHQGLLVEWQRAHLLTHLRRPFVDVVVKARDRHTAILIVERRQYPRQRHRGIHHRAAIAPRMQIPTRALHVDLEVSEPAQRRQDRRLARREHRRVGYDDGIRLEHRLVFFDEFRQVLASDLLLSLGDDDHVHRQLLPHRQMGFERLDVQEELAFVVDRPAREYFSVPHRRLERRRRPEIERLGRLHVVVTVDDHRRSTGRLSPFSDDDRMTRRRVNRRRHTDPVERRLKPLRRALGVRVVVGLGAHARNAQELVQLLPNARIVVGEELLEVGCGWCHGIASVSIFVAVKEV